MSEIEGKFISKCQFCGKDCEGSCEESKLALERFKNRMDPTRENMIKEGYRRLPSFEQMCHWLAWNNCDQYGMASWEEGCIEWEDDMCPYSNHCCQYVMQAQEFFDWLEV